MTKIRIFTITFSRIVMSIRKFTVTFTRTIINTWIFDVTFTRIMMITWYSLPHLLESQSESNAKQHTVDTESIPTVCGDDSFRFFLLFPITMFVPNTFGSMSAILRLLSFWQVSLSRGYHYQLSCGQNLYDWIGMWAGCVGKAWWYEGRRSGGVNPMWLDFTRVNV